MNNVNLKCSCGSIEGIAHNISANAGTRIVCHCGDCQTFANYLDSNSKVLDAFGGSDIYQMPMSQVEITKGAELMKCIKLKPKGLIRWYAGCCRTPIGNTMSSSMPFIGVIHSFMDDANDREKNIGLVRGYLFTKDDCPAERRKTSSFKIIVRVMIKILVWKIKGLNKPSFFFDSIGNPISDPLLIDSKNQSRTK